MSANNKVVRKALAILTLFLLCWRSIVLTGGISSTQQQQQQQQQPLFLLEDHPVENPAITAARHTGDCSNLPPNPHYIHFTMSLPKERKTMGKDTRSAMDKCSLESALLQSQPHEIVILWADANAIQQGQADLDLLKHKLGLLICHMEPLAVLFSDTPLANWTCWGQYCPNNHSNALRLSLLYKFGGTYLDTDIVSIDSTKMRIGNLAVVTWNDDTWFNQAFLRFPSVRHPLLWLLMDEFVNGFEGDRYGHNGPKLLDRVVRPCLIHDHDKYNNNHACADVTIVDEKQTYAPIPPSKTSPWLNSTQPLPMETFKIRRTWGFHWYAKYFFELLGCVHCGTRGHALFATYCPIVFGRNADVILCNNNTCSHS